MVALQFILIINHLFQQAIKEIKVSLKLQNHENEVK